MNPFVTKKSVTNNWVMPVSAMCLIVGFMGSLAWITETDRQGRLSTLPEDQRTRLAAGDLDLTEEYESMRAEVTKLRAENTRLQNAVAQNTNAGEALNKSLQELKVFAGITEATGPGVVVTLRDSTAPAADAFDPTGQIIHDTDVLRTVNELWNAGAEAVSVNNKRVGPGTNFRCVGTTILVDNVKIASPVVIRAIGDSETLYGAMNLPGGILDDLRATDPKMVKIEVAKKLDLPVYAGSTAFKFVTVPKETP